MNSPGPISSLFLRLVLVLASWWKESLTCRGLLYFTKGVAIALEGSFLGRVMVPYQVPMPFESWGHQFLQSIRFVWTQFGLFVEKVFTPGWTASTFSRLGQAAGQDWTLAPITAGASALFGYVTLFFALNFLSGDLRGFSMSIAALALFLLSLAGIMVPARVLRGSWVQRIFANPFQDSHASFVYLVGGGILGIGSFLWNPIPVLSLAIILAFALWTLARPEVGLYAVAAYALLDYAIRAALPGTIGKLWSIALLALIFLAIFLRLARDRGQHFYFTSVSVFLLLFLLWGAMSIFYNSVTFAVGFEGLRAILQTALFFLATLNALRDRSSLRRLLLVLCLVVMIISLYGIYQYLTNVPVKPGWVDKDFEQDVSSRAFSIFGSPNALSGFLVLFIPLFLVLFLDERRPLAKVIFFLAFVLAMLAIFFTLTRGGWLALGAALLFLGIFHDRRVLLFLLGAGLLLPLLPQFAIRFQTLISGEYWTKSASTGRLYRWDIATEIAQAHPILGSGPGSFGGAVASRAGYWPGVYADNYYLKTLAETGYGGLVLFLLVLGSVLWEGIRRVRSLLLKTDQNLAWAIMTGLVGFLIHMITENLWEEPSLAVAFWFLAGILLALPWMNERALAT
jgi:putative inorganic carbon (HCO3(-)) transporter